MREARHEAGANGVGDSDHDDRNRGVRRLHRADRARAGGGDDQVDPMGCKLGGERRIALEVAFTEPIFEGDVDIFDVAALPQTGPKRVPEVFDLRNRRRVREPADAPQRSPFLCMNGQCSNRKRGPERAQEGSAIHGGLQSAPGAGTTEVTGSGPVRIRRFGTVSRSCSGSKRPSNSPACLERVCAIHASEDVALQAAA